MCRELCCQVALEEWTSWNYTSGSIKHDKMGPGERQYMPWKLPVEPIDSDLYRGTGLVWVDYGFLLEEETADNSCVFKFRRDLSDLGSFRAILLIVWRVWIRTAAQIINIQRYPWYDSNPTQWLAKGKCLGVCGSPRQISHLSHFRL